MIQDYYCQQKFDYLTIRLYDGTVASCCQSTYHSLPISVIRHHGIFNFPSIIADRVKMLDNQIVEDCEPCWTPERKGLISRRQKFKTTDRIYHSTKIIKPKFVNLIVSNTCNQTCVYCCKNFSHSWLKDVIENGEYATLDDGDRFKISNKDRVLHQLSQKQLARSGLQQEILAQISNFVGDTEFQITGGEPLLYNDLLDIISRISSAKKITISTGLHVDAKRFSKLCHELYKICPSIELAISAENIGQRHEFVRYGSEWSNFLHNLDTAQGFFSTKFRATASNLTMFGLGEFLEYFHDQTITLIPLQDPVYLRPGIMDPESKRNLSSALAGLHPSIADIIDHLADDSDLSQKDNLKIFFCEFAKRRALKLDIFPESFLRWLEIE